MFLKLNFLVHFPVVYLRVRTVLMLYRVARNFRAVADDTYLHIERFDFVDSRFHLDNYAAPKIIDSYTETVNLFAQIFLCRYDDEMILAESGA